MQVSFKERVNNMKRKDGSSVWEPPKIEEIIPDEIEYNEKGLIKRSGYDIRRGPATFGKEFEEENFEKTFKPLLVFILGFFVLAGVLLVIAVKYLLA